MILNTKPLKDIEYGMPVIAEGTYFAKIDQQNVKLKPNKAGNGNNLLVPVTILGDLITRAGVKLENRNQVKLTRYISLVPSDNYDPNSMLKELAVACNVPESKEDFEISDIVGYIKVKIAYNEPQGQYAESNSIARFLPIKESDNFNPPA